MLVRGLIVEGTVSMLYGAPRSFKSFVLLDLTLRSAAGMPWHERRTATRPVIYVASEGSAGIGFRMKAWSTLHRRSLFDLPVMLRWDVALAMNPTEVLGIKAICNRLGRGYGSSVVGTFTKAFPIDKEFRIETPSSDRVLRRIAVNENGKIECWSEAAPLAMEN